MFVATRSKKNPLVKPDAKKPWMAAAAFNPSPASFHKKDFLLFRALSARRDAEKPEDLSTIGIVEEGKVPRQFIVPSKIYDTYGCEDPRVCKIGSTYYIFYTALGNFPFSGDGIKAAVAISKDLKTITAKHLCTPFNAKAMCLFPEKIDGKYYVIFSADTDRPPAKTVIMSVEKISDLWDHDMWDDVYPLIGDYSIDLRRGSYDHIEVGAPPIKTKHGWLLIYSHIQNYFGGGDKMFGIEAVLLDLDDPRKIVGRTEGPILAPTEIYEREGIAGNIVFPTGAQIKGDILEIYYGAADTVSCVATVGLDDLINSIFSETKDEYHFKRYQNNPILLPKVSHGWESQGALNPAAIDLDGTVRILYRAFSKNNTSTIGYAESKNGLDISYRAPLPIYVPREDFEMKKRGGNSGCEDPRVVSIGDRIYMFYTAWSGDGVPQVAATSIRERDFVTRNWHWSKPVTVSPAGIDDKDACILPEKIKDQGKDKWFFLHRIGTDICADYLASLDFEKDKSTRCITVMRPRHGMWDSEKIGISAPPIKTAHGWLLLYHGISKNHHSYRVGVALLDLKDPTKVLARSTDPILEPTEPYERSGLVNNVVFPCGVIERKGLLYVYYGGGDTVVGVATMKLKNILEPLVRSLDTSKAARSPKKVRRA